MKARQQTIKRVIGTLLLVIGLFLLPATALAIETVPLNLDAVDGSGVSGGAVLTPAGQGTNVTLEIQGLPAGADDRYRLGRHLQRRSQRGWRKRHGVSLYAHLEHLGLQAL